MKRILYLMGIDWYWIKQRPQILAEFLSENFDVTVVYLKEIFQKQSLRKENDELEKSIAVPAVPYRDKNVIAYNVQKRLYYPVIKDINKYEIIWITHPLLHQYIPLNYQGKIVYDCMDNYEALCSDKKIKKKLYKVEQNLIRRADWIFVSSNELMKKKVREGGTGKIDLVRNGFVSKKTHFSEISAQNSGKRYRIAYFGTIADWFDFSLLEKSLEIFSDIEYHLWGPVSDVCVPKHPRLILEGIVEHNQLWEKVKGTDCLIMPFKVNDIIRDVDPVKLYEYISMGKAIVSVYYEEIERFRPFVSFYDTLDTFINLLRDLKKNDFRPGYTEKEQLVFLSENSWERRYEIIKKRLEQ